MPQSGLIRKNCTLNRTQRRGVRINISSTGVAGGVFQTAAVVNYDRQLRVHGSPLGGGGAGRPDGELFGNKSRVTAAC